MYVIKNLTTFVMVQQQHPNLMNRRKLLRKIRYYANSLCDLRMPTPMAGVTVDVVIPFTLKDMAIFPVALEGIRRCVNHPIANIYVVAQPHPQIVEFCRQHDLQLVDETSVLGFGPSRLNVQAGTPPRDRSGWIFQQLLKLSGTIGTSPYILTVDSDHVMLRPHTFIASDGRLCLYRSKELHQPYYDNLWRLMAMHPDAQLSYVAHKMIFDRSILMELHADIERRHPGKKWYEAIIDSLDLTQASCFSEFELYGNYVPCARKRLLTFKNHHLKCNRIENYDALVARYGRRLRAVTFPDYL